jgi:alanine racemase
MNLTTIDISDVDVREGQEVIFISEEKGSPLSLEQQAKRAGMIPYDMLVHLNKEMFSYSLMGYKIEHYLVNTFDVPLLLK